MCMLLFVLTIKKFTMAPINTTSPKTTGSNGKGESTYNEKEKPGQIDIPLAKAVCDAIGNRLGPKGMNKMEVPTSLSVVVEEPFPQASGDREEELQRLAETHNSVALALKRRAVAERRFSKAVEKRLATEAWGLQFKAAAERELAAAIEQRVAAQAREAAASARAFEDKHWPQGSGRKPSRGSTSVAEALAASARALEEQDALSKEMPTTPPVVEEEPSPQASRSRVRCEEELIRLSETHNSVALDLERRAVAERRFRKDAAQRLVTEAWRLQSEAVAERELAAAIEQRVAAPGKYRPLALSWMDVFEGARALELSDSLNRDLKSQDTLDTVSILQVQAANGNVNITNDGSPIPKQMKPQYLKIPCSKVFRSKINNAKSQDIEAGDGTMDGTPNSIPLDNLHPAGRLVSRSVTEIAKSQDIEPGEDTTGTPAVLDSLGKFIPFQNGTLFLDSRYDGGIVMHEGPIVWFDTGRRDKNSIHSL